MKWKILLSAVLLLILVACARGQTEIKPPEIHYGQDQCDECGMIISDPRFASGFLHEVDEGRYESLIFDDIGNMLAHMQNHPGQHIVAWYVHDYTSEEWLDARQAYYVSSHEIHTPMGHGIAAHATQEAAQDMAAKTNGQVLDWPGLQMSHDHIEHAHTQ
jgi:copper chaperone NosL